MQTNLQLEFQPSTDGVLFIVSDPNFTHLDHQSPLIYLATFPVPSDSGQRTLSLLHTDTVFYFIVNKTRFFVSTAVWLVRLLFIIASITPRQWGMTKYYQNR